MDLWVGLFCWFVAGMGFEWFGGLGGLVWVLELLWVCGLLLACLCIWGGFCLLGFVCLVVWCGFGGFWVWWLFAWVFDGLCFGMFVSVWGG